MSATLNNAILGITLALLGVLLIGLTVYINVTLLLELAIYLEWIDYPDWAGRWLG